MNTDSLMMNAETSILPEVASSSWMDQVSHALGISGDPQGFFLYLLIMVGIFIVISILIYNWLEERRFNKQVESNFSSIEEDALLDDKQQQFFDKFASTTGVLNDEPPEGTFIDEAGEPLEDDRSIEDVYAELLETMSKRNRKEKVEPESLVIDHQQVDVASEPAFDVQVDVVEIASAHEPSLYIPESAEITDAEIVTDSSVETGPIAADEGAGLDLAFGEEDIMNMPVDIAADVALKATQLDVASAAYTPVSDEQASEAVANDSSEDVLATEEDSIKAIINRAFKEKYNPNFKAEQEENSEQETLDAVQNEPVVSQVQSDVEDIQEADIRDSITEEADDGPDVDENDHALIESFEEAPVEETPKEELPPIITETVAEELPIALAPSEVDEVPVLNFPAEEVSELPEPEAELDQETLDAEASAREFLKGLEDTENEQHLLEQEHLASDSEPPTLDDAVTQPLEQDEAIEPLSQTYQQLLNADPAPDVTLNQSDAPLFTPKIPQDQEEMAETSEGVATEHSPADVAKQEVAQGPEAASTEKPSLFTDELPALLNPHIDFIATVEAAKGSNAAFILSSFSAFHQQFEFPVFVFMQCQQSQWLLLNDVTEVEISRHLERYKPVHVTASIQMADRTGPISRNSIQRFKQSLSEIAVTMGTTAQWMDTSEPIDRAASLDAFCIEVDKTMFFHLANTPTPFTGTKLKGLVETQGMVLEKDGAYKYYDLNTESGIKRGVPDFVLFNRENHKFTEEMLRSSVIKAVTMQLDIPLILSSGAALDRMVVIAQSLESSLNAKLVDDKNRLITDVHLARIREQIKSIHAAMQLRGIVPGSTHAQRLFS